MNDSLHNLETIREYLLGRITDDKTLEGIEELLFTDDEFCQKAEIIEDELINDYVFQNLVEKDLIDFEKTLENNADRRTKVQVTQVIKAKAIETKVDEKVSVFDSIKAFFRQPIYAGGFALFLIVLILGGLFWFRPNSSDELAQLEIIYGKERPVEPRISDFDYAPLIVTRGEENQSDEQKRKLRLIETKLLEKVDTNPSAANYHALGVFYLTQAKYAESIKELEKAVNADDKNSKFYNDLGSAYFEFGRLEKDNKLLNIAKANESFSKSLELNPNSLEALFNKSLALQELNLPRQAKESWQLYLQKDSTSKWADEARKYLEKIAQMQSSFKTKEQVLEDFLTAYRNGNEEFAWKINSQTKEMISGVWLPDQLSRRYLVARKNKDETTAKESIEALTYIGNLEKERNADFFVHDLAEYYANVGDDKVEELLKAKELLSEGYKLAPKNKNQEAINQIEKVKNILSKNLNYSELIIANYFIAINKRELGKLVESSESLSKITEICEKKNYDWLQIRVLSSLGENQFRTGFFSKGIQTTKKAVEIAEKTNDQLGMVKNYSNLADVSQLFGNDYNALKSMSALINSEHYYDSKLQKLRNLWRIVSILKNLHLFYSATSFSEESLKVAEETDDDLALIFDSIIDLILLNFNLNKIEKSISLADESISIAQKFTDETAKKRNLAFANLQKAHLLRLTQNYEKSLELYEIAIKDLNQIPEYKLDFLDAHKGKLICFEKLSKKDEIETELLTISNLFNEYRQEISQEENRNTFFDREQSFQNIAINFYLAQNNSRKAFEYAENSKARSLLDLIENKGFYDANEGKIVFKESVQQFSLEQIQTQLPPNVQIIQYAVLEDKVAVWLISNNQFEVVTAPILTDSIEQKVKDYLDLIKDKSPQTKQISKELFDILLKPILAKLDKSKQLCIVPDGILYYLPFASLVSSESNKYLIEDFTLFYSPSATTSVVLSEKAKSKAQTENLLVIGNPEFNRSNNSTLQNLESAEKEANEISKFYEKPTKLIKSQATKSEVLANLSKANVFHFAGHYVANPNSSLNSKLLLTQPTNSNDEFEGELRASEVLQFSKANLKLAVLSACETGIERYYKGEGAIGMARTFLAIGTPIVVASQWKVESESTSELMKAFHRNRKEKGLITPEALRQAQLEMLAKKEFSEPYFWSAFSTVGGNVNF